LNLDLTRTFPSRQSSAVSRRQFLSLGAAGLGTAIATGCGKQRATGYPGFALITAAGENALAIVDLNTFRLSHKLDLGAAASSVSSDSSHGYVVTPSTGAVHVIDSERLTDARPIKMASRLDLLRLTPTAGEVVGICSGDCELIFANAVDRTTIRRTKIACTPVDVDVQLHSGSRRIYAAISGGASGTIELLDLHSAVRRKRQLACELGAIRFRQDGQLLFAANHSEKTLMVLDTESLATVCELSLPMRPENFVFSADHGQLFISGAGVDGVAIVFAYDTIEVEQTILTGRTPGAMACSDEPRYLFVASRNGSEISILSVDTRKMIALTQVGDRPSRIVITPDQQYALVLNEGSGDLAVIRIPAIAGNRTRNGASALPSQILTLRGVSLFAMIPVSRQPADLAVLDRRA
jgi:hypothetical protein